MRGGHAVDERSVLNVALHLNDIHELFAPAAVDPFSERYGDHHFATGIDYVAKEMYANSSWKAIHTTIMLPADQVTPDLEARTSAAVRRYSHGQFVRIDQEIRATRRRVIRSFGIAIVALIAFNAAAAALNATGLFLAEVLADGLIIAGWVILWFPLDEFMQSWYYDRLGQSIYQRLGNMQITIRPEPAQADVAVAD
jgi:hypothetical protein